MECAKLDLSSQARFGVDRKLRELQRPCRNEPTDSFKWPYIEAYGSSARIKSLQEQIPRAKRLPYRTSRRDCL
jgi:hypothetical protein